MTLLDAQVEINPREFLAKGADVEVTLDLTNPGELLF